MVERRSVQWVVSILVAVLLVASIGVAPDRASTELLKNIVLAPGLFAIGIIWPEGPHTGDGSSAIGIWTMFAMMYAVSVVVWGAVLFVLQRVWVNLRARWRRSVSPV